MRSARGADMIAFVTITGTDRITLELEPGEPIHGRLLDGNGAVQTFHGWLELCAALETARPHVGPEPDAEAD
jgi:hypothetical protein